MIFILIILIIKLVNIQRSFDSPDNLGHDMSLTPLKLEGLYLNSYAIWRDISLSLINLICLPCIYFYKYLHSFL